MKSKTIRAFLLACSIATLAGCGSGDGTGGAVPQEAGAHAAGAVSAPTAGSPPVSKFDTTVAVAASRSCLSGGCHETDARLLDQYRQSRMTQVNVKCNACHGTHTAAEVGKPKPNLTGYHASSGPTGYVVGKDRCLACHQATLAAPSHPSNPKSCTSCHAPHVFGKPAR